MDFSRPWRSPHRACARRPAACASFRKISPTRIYPVKAGRDPYRRKIPTFHSELDRTLDTQLVELGKVQTDFAFRLKYEPGKSSRRRKPTSCRLLAGTGLDGAGLVEGHHHRAVQPRPGQQPQLVGLVGEAELRAVRAEEAAGMGLEGDCKAGLPWARPIRKAASITARWPRWTPSKLPMATTAPRGISAAGVVSRITVKPGVISEILHGFRESWSNAAGP